MSASYLGSFQLGLQVCCPFSFFFLFQAQSFHDYKMSQTRTKRLSMNNDQSCPNESRMACRLVKPAIKVCTFFYLKKHVTIFQCSIYMLCREISRYSYKSPCRQTMRYEGMHLHACCILWMCMDVRIWPHTRKN